MSPEDLIGRLLEVVPEFESVYHDHLDANFGELLPHVLMGEFVQWFEHKLQMQDTSVYQGTVENILELLEFAYTTGDSNTRNVIEASFLENLSQSAESYAELKRLLGPNLRKQLAQMEY
jgi:hypothetical protein